MLLANNQWEAQIGHMWMIRLQMSVWLLTIVQTELTRPVSDAFKQRFTEDKIGTVN